MLLSREFWSGFRPFRWACTRAASYAVFWFGVANVKSVDDRFSSVIDYILSERLPAKLIPSYILFMTALELGLRAQAVVRSWGMVARVDESFSDQSRLDEFHNFDSYFGEHRIERYESVSALPFAGQSSSSGRGWKPRANWSDFIQWLAGPAKAAGISLILGGLTPLFVTIAMRISIELDLSINPEQALVAMVSIIALFYSAWNLRHIVAAYGRRIIRSFLEIAR